MDRRKKGGQKNDKNVYRALVMVTQFGINMLVPIGMMCALGIWLDKRLDTSYWTTLLFFAGAVAGGRNIYRMAKQVYDGQEKKESDSAYEDNRNIERQK